MAVPFFLCGIGILFATCAACFYRMGAADWAHEKKFLIDSLESLESENAKLREERDHWHVEQVHAFGNWKDSYKRAVELEAENAKLRDLMYERAHVYAIQHMTEAELRIVATNVMEDNAKLRELIHDMLPFAEAGMDNTCVTRSCCMFDKCTSEVGDKCLIEEHIAARMRELGVIE